MLPSLDSFITSVINGSHIHNSYVTEPGFNELYVRFGQRNLGGIIYNNVIDIARVEVSKKGNGIFTALVSRMLDKNIHVYVECVFNPRLAKKLIRDGFSSIYENSFYKLSELNIGGS